MSDLQDLIARSSIISYQQGRKDERLAILRLAKEASMNKDNGDYVYLRDTMRKSLRKRTNEQLYADFKQAAGLLDDDNLIWSEDFNNIRRDLARYISAKATLGAGNNPHLIQIVQTLIADENDITI